MVRYFFDSYAVIELVEGNPRYAKYTIEPIIITIFNLVEIYWHFLNEFNESKANEIHEQILGSVVDLNDETIKEAVKFRKENKKRDLSYADCIGYIYAMRNNLVFLTGDKQFENMKNVEYVK